MARISILPIDHNITADDIAIGTDSEPGNNLNTKNFSIGNIAEFIMSYIEDNSSCCGNGSVTLVKYGYLYNWYTVDNSRNIASVGWSVPSIADMITLRDYLDPINTTEPAYYTNTAGGKMKETGLTYWDTPNTGADNVALFNGRGSGVRSSNGGFNSVKIRATFWSSSVYVAPNISTGVLRFDNNIFYTAANITNSKSEGLSIRLVKDATTLTNGQTGTYTGNDGKIYRTICIGTQEWVADNIAETKYRDRTLIPEVTDNTVWVGLSTGARCSYDNDPSNAL